jgi:putative Holliday junction resolvase
MNNLTHNLKLHYISTFLKEDFKILGIDYGTRKIGAAIFHSSLDDVIPLGVVTNFKTPLEVVEQLVKEYNCIAVVIGICKNSHSEKNVLKLQKAIEANLAIPVILEDETLTTYAANEILKDMGIKREMRGKVDDAIAADLILENFICDFRRYIYSNKRD